MLPNEGMQRTALRAAANAQAVGQPAPDDQRQEDGAVSGNERQRHTSKTASEAGIRL